LQEFAATEDFVERHLLSHIAQPLTHHAGIHQGIHTRNPHRTAARSQQCGQNPQRGGFPSTIGTKQSKQAAGRNTQIKPFERRHCPIAFAIALAEIPQLNRRSRHRFRQNLRPRTTAEGTI
jgi:alpha-beta hydrolase superfamily lysophospholipase